MRMISYPFIGKLLFPNIVKSFPEEKGKLFFTFDDGPNPEVTPYILDILKKYNVKATFFCLGENILKFPTLFNEIVSQGHTIGNHGYRHINGLKISKKEFIENVEKGFVLTHSQLFRPPYGKLKCSQYNYLKDKYSIIAWDVMAYDFDNELTIKGCFDIVTKNARNGSIITFHDNLKAKEKVISVLPVLIEHFNSKGCLIQPLKCYKIVKTL